MAAAERLEYMEEIRAEVNRRRTFAIISHPDAGKNDNDGKAAAVRRRDPPGGIG